MCSPTSANAPRGELRDLMRILEQDQVVVEPGDNLCLWADLDQLIMVGNGQPDPAPCVCLVQ